MPWVPDLDLQQLAIPPRTYTRAVRTAAALRDVVAQLDPERAHRYRRRDVTGDGVDETFCNFFVRDALHALGVPTPKLRANELADWLAVTPDWWRVDAHEADSRATHGFPTVAVWRNPTGRSGHVALVLPMSVVRPGLRIAQAGHSNFNDGGLLQGFGRAPVVFWTHD